MIFRCVALLILTSLLVSCAQTPVKSPLQFQLSGRDHLYGKTSWSFAGRLAMADKNESFSASIDWKHQGSKDKLELAGPFGQGRTLIELTNDSVVIDYGDERLQYFGNADELVFRHTGMAIPVSALKYWVLGLLEPEAKYEMLESGFVQSGWNVRYQQMQIIGQDELPRKIRVEQDDVKLKLIINHWGL